MQIGDHVKYKTNTKYGMDIEGILYSIDEGYRAYIFSDHDITGIEKGDLVKVLLREGELTL